MVENFGPLVEFDFLYHRSGPQAGQPRGYAFVTFKSPDCAQAAMNTLDGKNVLGRRMAVKWAHAQDEVKLWSLLIICKGYLIVLLPFLSVSKYFWACEILFELFLISLENIA